MYDGLFARSRGCLALNLQSQRFCVLLEIEGKRSDWLDNGITIPTIYVCFVLYCITLYLYGSYVYINLAIVKEDSLSSWTSLSPVLPSSLSILVRISLDSCLYCIWQP